MKREQGRHRANMVKEDDTFKKDYTLKKTNSLVNLLVDINHC